MSNHPQPPAPELTHVGRLSVQVAPPVDLGQSASGHRRMVTILGGTLEGEIGSGVVLPGGADWQTVHEDGSLSIDAHYAIRLDAGDMVTIRSTGVRAEVVDGTGWYFRTGILIEAPEARPYLRRHLFLSSGVRTGSLVSLDLYRVG